MDETDKDYFLHGGGWGDLRINYIFDIFICELGLDLESRHYKEPGIGSIKESCGFIVPIVLNMGSVIFLSIIDVMMIA